MTTTINPFFSYADPARGREESGNNQGASGNSQGASGSNQGTSGSNQGRNTYEFNYNIPANRQSLSSPLLSDPIANEPISNTLINNPLMNTNNPFSDPFFTYNTPDRFALGSTSAATFATEPTTLYDNLQRNAVMNRESTTLYDNLERNAFVNRTLYDNLERNAFVNENPNMLMRDMIMIHDMN